MSSRRDNRVARALWLAIAGRRRSRCDRIELGRRLLPHKLRGTRVLDGGERCYMIDERFLRRDDIDRAHGKQHYLVLSIYRRPIDYASQLSMASARVIHLRRVPISPRMRFNCTVT